MKNARKSVLALFLILLLSSISLLYGCGEKKTGGTISEPEITGDYLASDYAQQLTDDGANTILGVVTLTKNDDSNYLASVSEKEVVPSANYDEGYYIADTNRVIDMPLGSSGRIACLDGDKLVVKTADQFIKDQGKAPSDEVHLYTVYVMGDSAELILECAPEDVETE